MLWLLRLCGCEDRRRVCFECECIEILLQEGEAKHESKSLDEIIHEAC